MLKTNSCYNCRHCVSEETEPGMRYCLITSRLVEDGFGNGDFTPCKKHEQKPPMRVAKPFGHDIIREEDGLGPDEFSDAE